MPPDKSDIARRLRQTRANMLGTDDEEHYWDCHTAADEIDRLRLTDAEREAIEEAIRRLWGLEIAATLQGLLARMSGNAPLSYSGQSTSTPEADATPEGCTVPVAWTSRPYWVDPPSGWQYGFPRLYDPAKDGDMLAWMIANGYPKQLATQGLACTFTAQAEDVG